MNGWSDDPSMYGSWNGIFFCGARSPLRNAPSSRWLCHSNKFYVWCTEISWVECPLQSSKDTREMLFLLWKCNSVTRAIVCLYVIFGLKQRFHSWNRKVRSMLQCTMPLWCNNIVLGIRTGKEKRNVSMETVQSKRGRLRETVCWR